MSVRTKVYTFLNFIVLAGAISACLFNPPSHDFSSTNLVLWVACSALLLNILGWVLNDRAISDMRTAAHRFIVDRIVDLRRPLQGLIGIQDLYSKNKSAAESNEYFDIADFCARFLIRQLDRIQFFSEVEQGHFSARPRTANIKEVVQNAISAAIEQANNNDVTITEHWDSSLPDAAIIDDRLLMKALTEIIENAVHYGGGYRVVLSISRQRGDENQIEFSIADHGPGLSTEQAAALIKQQRYSQPRLGWDQAHKGLGFYLVKQISKLMGATFTVDSQKGRGVRASLVVPVAPVRDERPTWQATLKSSFTSVHRRPLVALVVDDDPITSKVVSTILSALNVKVTSVDNGDDAIAAAQRNCFDLIFMDIEMPGMDGWQASDIILNELALHNRPHIVALTSYCRQEDINKARDLGLFELIAKPAHLDELERVLERIYEARETQLNSRPKQASPSASIKAATEQRVQLLNAIELSERFGGNLSMCQSVLANAATVFSVEMDRVASAISTADLQTVATAIHKMQGELAVILCRDGVELCKQISSAVCASNWEAINQNFDHLADLVEQLLTEIEAETAMLAALAA